ncbi:MAG: ATPase [Alphaproteobacteria bacterium]|nr:ATPase [Alphaproteobacteria bacterium]
MKRFYKAAEAAPVAALDRIEGADGYAVLLDGKPIRTATRVHLVAPTRALADAVAAEWAAQGETIVPDSMPMMTLAATALDRVVPQREAVAGDAAAYAGSDLLCYRSDDQPELATRQAERWQPLLDWAAETYGARLAATEGVMPLRQENAALMLLARRAGALDAFRLTALHVMTTSMGSLILALAVLEGRLGPADAFELSVLDERFQAERWGEDAQAAARRDRLAREIDEAARYLALL